MTTIFEKIEAKKPHTHVFIIGVGEYPHLIGGKSPTLDEPMGLKQLTSPPISAKAFADWILKDLNNPDAPLGSVELLLSPVSVYERPTDGQQFAVEAAKMVNITKAFDRWYQRCDAHEKNVAIFYFCGHGIKKADELLLAEDFGQNQNRPLENAINFRQTYLGMANCTAKVQCYFIDSCRQVPDELLKLDGVSSAQPLIAPKLCGYKPRDARILYASAVDGKAYGHRGKVTRFTDALIKSLRGGGSKRDQRKWIVTTNVLSDAVIEILKQENAKTEPKYHQIPVYEAECSYNSTIHLLDRPPKVTVTVGLTPNCASAFAELYIRKGSLVYRERVPPESGDWKEEVEADVYTAYAHFPTGEYQNPDEEDFWADTPYKQVEVRFNVRAIP